MKTHEDVAPWYRQVWFWFLFAPLFVVVCVSLMLVTVAFRHADDVVVDSYYKQGRMINQTLEQDRRALELGLTADLRFDRETGEVFVQVAHTSAAEQINLPDQLLLRLDHPFEADRDQRVLLKQVSAESYRGELNARPAHNWYLSLLPEIAAEKYADADWLLSGNINFEVTEETRLQSRVSASEAPSS